MCIWKRFPAVFGCWLTTFVWSLGTARRPGMSVGSGGLGLGQQAQSRRTGCARRLGLGWEAWEKAPGMGKMQASDRLEGMGQQGSSLGKTGRRVYAHQSTLPSRACTGTQDAWVSPLLYQQIYENTLGKWVSHPPSSSAGPHSSNRLLSSISYCITVWWLQPCWWTMWVSVWSYLMEFGFFSFAL